VNRLLLPRQVVFDYLGVAFLSESVTRAEFRGRGRSQLTALRACKGKIHARRTICAFLEHGVFQKLRDNLSPRLEYQFVLVCVPVTPTMHLKGFLDIVVDPLNV